MIEAGGEIGIGKGGVNEVVLVMSFELVWEEWGSQYRVSQQGQL